VKYILKSFFFLCCSLSFCFAGVKEDFRQELEGSVAILKSLDERISHLEEANYETYFGQAVKRLGQVEKAKELFSCFQRGESGYFRESAHWDLMHIKLSEEEVLSKYCFMIRN
jgi:chemotaxis methyl-accepting protein methylase